MRKPSLLWFGVIFALFCLTEWLVWFGGPSDEAKTRRDEWVLEYYIAATAYAEYGFQNNPDLRKIFEWFNVISLEKEVSIACGYADRKGWLSNERRHQWALLTHLFGDAERAEELVKEFPIPESKRGRFVRQFLEPAFSVQGETKELEDDGSWELLYIGAQKDPGGDSDQRLRYSSQYMAQKGVMADVVLGSLGFIAVLMSALWVLRRREFQTPVPFRMAKLWQPLAILQCFFLLMIVAVGVSKSGSLLLYRFPAWDVLIGFLLFLGIPVLGLGFRFCPGWESMNHVFRIRFHDLNKNWVDYLSLGFFGLILSFLIGWLLFSLEIGMGLLDVRDYLHADVVDPTTQISSLITMIVLAPYFEEVIHRGFILRALENKLSPVVSAVVSSALFATYHWYSVMGWISVFLAGLIFCYLARRSGSLWPGMITHALFNFYCWVSVNGWYAFG